MQASTTEDKTIGEIVATDYRTATVFENHGIDFCCGGKVALGTICAEKGLDLATITRELEAVLSEPAERSQNYSSWALPFLADYIVNTHHAYLKENDEQIAAYARKIAGVHGAHHPEVIRIAAIFDRIATDMAAHLKEEEEVFFPAVRRVDAARISGNTPDEQDRVNSSNTYGFVAEAIVVEVDPDTGQVRFLKWASVHDAGKILNPEIVRGQVLGSIVQAIGGSLYEEQAYDENGQCLTASFADYLCPTAMEMPKVDIGHFESQSVLTALGSKGCGESSAMSVPPAIGNAIADALAPLGVIVDKLPLSPSNIWHLMAKAKAKKN